MSLGPRKPEPRPFWGASAELPRSHKGALDATRRERSGVSAGGISRHPQCPSAGCD